MTPPVVPKRKEQDDNRRSDIRAKLDLRVDYGTAFDVHTTAYMHNIGYGGVFVRTESPLEFGAKVEIEFTLPESFRTIRAVAKVAWAKREEDPPMPAGMGLAFTDIAPGDRKALHEYVDQLARNKPPEK